MHPLDLLHFAALICIDSVYLCSMATLLKPLPLATCSFVTTASSPTLKPQVAGPETDRQAGHTRMSPKL